MSIFNRATLALAILSGTANATGISGGIGQNIGGGISGFEKGISTAGGTPPPPLTPCTSTGIYDLGNVCNDIYFIGALK